MEWNWNIAIGGILAANLIGLNFKIIFEWLKNRKIEQTAPVDKTPEEKPASYCPLHDTHNHDIEELKRCNMFLKQEVSKHDVVLTERTTEIFKKLKTVSDDFRALRDTMESMGKSLAVLSDQADRKLPHQ